MVPKRNHNFPSTNSQPCSNESVQSPSNAHNLSEHDDFIAGDNIFNTSTMSAASFGSTSGTGTGNSNIQRQIISMEDDELGDDAELISGKSYFIDVHTSVSSLLTLALDSIGFMSRFR